MKDHIPGATLLLILFFWVRGCSVPPATEGGSAVREGYEPGRRAIVAFSFSPRLSEDWNWIFHEVHTRCATRNLVVYQAPPKSEVVSDFYPEDPQFRVDLAPYKKAILGYLFIESGREIHFQEYDLSHAIIEGARDYFGTGVCQN